MLFYSSPTHTTKFTIFPAIFNLNEKRKHRRKQETLNISKLLTFFL